MRLPIIARRSNLGAIIILSRFTGIVGFLLINWPTPIAPEFRRCSRWTRLPKLRSARAKSLS